MTRLHHYVISAALMGAALATLWVTLPAQAQPAGTPATDQPCGQGGTALRVVVLDRARAEQLAADLRGECEPQYRAGNGPP